jgi:HSP20 family protein
MADLIRLDPFREMMTLRDAMDRMFENAFISPRTTNWFTEGEIPLALDVVEEDDKYIVEASVPGINPDDLEITYDNNMLTIKGEVKEEKEIEEKRYHIRERRFGTFSRSIALPSTINVDKIEAEYKDGVLNLTLPKVEEAKPKKIKVRAVKGSKVLEGTATDIRSKN